MDSVLYYLDIESYVTEECKFTKNEHNVAFTIGRNLKDFRIRFSYTQEKLAQIMGVSISQYRKYESGVDIPKYHTMLRWTLLTGCNFYCLLRDTCFADILPKELLSWKLIPFFRVAARLKNKPFEAMVDLIRALEFSTSDTLPENFSYLPCPDIDIKLALEEIDKETYHTISRGLKSFRTERNLRESEMANMLGVSLRTYRTYEASTIFPKFTCLVAVRFLCVFKVHMSSLMPKTVFASFVRHKMNRLSYIAPLISAASDSQQVQLQRMFSLLDGISKDNPIYAF